MKKVTKNKILIAEFMGYKNSLEEKTPEYCRWYHPDKLGMMFYHEEFNFHSSWDWLMPVLQKILDITFSDEGNETYDSEEFYAIRDCIPDIDQTYKAVLDFIKRYNENS